MRLVLRSLLLFFVTHTCLYGDEERDYNFIRALFNDQSYNLAEQETDRFLTEYPDSKFAPNVLFIKAESQYKVKDFKASVINFTKFTRRFPNTEFYDDALLRTSQSYFYLANYDSTIACAQRIPRGSLFYDGQYLTGEAFYRKNEYQVAVNYYQMVLSSSDKKEHIPAALYSLGFCYQNLRNYPKAITYFDSLINTFPTNELTRDASLAKGNCLVGLGRTDEAIKYLENVSEKKETIAAQAKILIGEILLDRKEYERARIQYERIMRYYPESDYLDDGQFGIGLSYYLEGNYVRAIDSFENLLKNFSKSDLINKTRYYLGLALAANQDLSQARQIFADVQGELKNEASYQLALTYYFEKNYEVCIKMATEQIGAGLGQGLKDQYRILLGESYLALGNSNEAINQFTKVNKPEVYLKAGIISFRGKDYKKAITLLKEVGNKLPDSLAAEAYFYQAESNYRLSQYPDAVRDYNLIIEKFPHSSRLAEVYYGLGWVYYVQGQYADALKYFKKLPDNFPNATFVPEVLIKIGDCYFNIKNNEEAINSYQEVIKNYARSNLLGWAYLKAGNGFYRLNRFDEAKNYFAKAKIDTGLADQANYMSGFCLFRKGSYEEALTEFARVKESSPNYWSARYATADAYYNLGKYSEARWVYKTIVTRGDSALFSAAVDGLLLTYEKMGQAEEAIKDLEAFIVQIEENNKKVNLLLKKGNLLYNKQRYADAVLEYGRVISGYPGVNQVSEALYWSGRSWHQLKDHGRARQYFKDLVEQFPNSKYFDEANFLIGKMSYEIKEYQVAIDYLSKLKASKSFQDMINYYLGRSYFEKDEKSKSIELWQKTVSEFPESDGGTRSALELAKLKFKEKSFDDALMYLKSVILNRDDEVAVDAQYSIGEVYLAKNDFKNAAIEFMRLSYVYGKFKDWVPKAELRAAGAYKELGEKEQVRKICDKIIANYPGTSYAEEAKNLLAALNR